MFQLNVSADNLDKPPVEMTQVRPLTKAVHTMSFRMGMPTADRLEEIAIERRTTVQDLVAFALDKWLREEKLGEFIYPKKKRGRRQESENS